MTSAHLEDQKKLEIMHADSALSEAEAMRRGAEMITKERPDLYEDYLRGSKNLRS
jgi:hypothetical protein